MLYEVITLHLVVQAGRTAARRRVAKDPEDVAVLLVDGIAQGVLTHETVGQMNVDMGAGGVGA